MTYSDYVERVFARLPTIPEQEDIEGVKKYIAQCEAWGFTEEEARIVNYYSEEVSPQFSEEYALAKMRPIYQKYIDNGTLKPSRPNFYQ